MTELPTTFGKYYLTEKLATGGMAEIYLAKLIGPGGFEKQLVIKQIHPRLSGQRQFVDLFVAEAKTLVTLAHGNIVPVYELGVVDDIYYIAMDYIDGPTLYRLTEIMAGRGAQMEPAVAAWIAARVLDGLDYAHRKGDGVIHRDLSPRNVMLSRDGDVKLVDFGIAVTPGDSVANDSAPTGSFPYMSPEQVRREPLTVHSDLFSAGVLLWEMLAGRRLFARDTADATLAAVLREPIPRPSTVRDDVPTRLDELVMRALERDHDARWSSAGDMLAALNKYLYGLDATPGPRDVAALVATFCPPETRRLPTHVEANATQDAREDEPPPASGPATAVIPRDRRRPPQRHESFATHVELAPILDAGAAATEDGAPRSPAATQATDDDPDRPIPRPPPSWSVPGRRAPTRGGLVLTGLGAIVLAGAAVWMFYRGRERVLRAEEDAGVLLGAAADASGVVEPDPPPLPDASVPDPISVTPDASTPRDAIGPVPRDSGARNADAPPPLARPDAAVSHDAARNSATLRVGADPWGEIYVDGRLMGRTPRELVVPAGRHTIEIVFPAETPPRKQTFAVDLASGETKPIQADFTR